jgi:hypothetical protein
MVYNTQDYCVFFFLLFFFTLPSSGRWKSPKNPVILVKFQLTMNVRVCVFKDGCSDILSCWKTASTYSYLIFEGTGLEWCPLTSGTK